MGYSGMPEGAEERLLQAELDDVVPVAAAENDRDRALRAEANIERLVDERVALWARLEQITAERNEWKDRHGRAIAQCRFLHQDGLPREEWHMRHCGAMQEVARLTAVLAGEGDRYE